LAKQQELINQTARVIARQVVLVGLLAGLLAYWGREPMAWGLAYGGGLAALLAAMLSASLQRAAERGENGGAAALYRGAIERFLLVGAAVIFAATTLELHIGGVIGGLVIAHIVSFIEAATQHRPSRNANESGIGEQR
jgi:F0F1-type ATP synthase assembly protein I